MSATAGVDRALDTGRQPVPGPRRRRRPLLRRGLSHAVLIVLGLLFVAPFLWLVSTSLKTDSQLFTLPPEWIPHPFAWSNYPRATRYIPYFLYLANSLYVTIFVMLGTVASCSLVAYGFARIRWPGRDALFVLVLGSLMIPTEVVLIPQYVLFRHLEWVNTFNPLTVPSLTGSPVFIFLLRQFYLTIPEELSAAAKVDGASELQIYWHVILPLARPALTVVAILTFVSQWNSFLGPLIYLNDERLYTLALGMYGFFSAHGAEWSLLMAAAVIMVLPVIIMFFVFQRSFIEGITITGLKG